MLIYFLPPFRAGTKYSVAVFGMFDGGQSMPLAGEEKTTLSDAPEPTLPDSYGKTPSEPLWALQRPLILSKTA